ncbi:MAG: hypothetical protein LBT79_06875 [Elusimicrobiota bacterium]|jgi:hypothetical protein|nr:hypothetical protein [Elusimicrobiota bacterium]
MQNEISEITVKFNKDSSYLTKKEFVAVYSSIERMFVCFTHDILKNKSQYEILIMPSQKGSFIVTIGIIVGLYQFASSEIGKNLIKGLTGNEPSYYYEKLGELVRDCIVKLFKIKTKNLKITGMSETNISKICDIRKDFYIVIDSNKEIKSIEFFSTSNSNIIIDQKEFGEYINEYKIEKANEYSDDMEYQL